MDDSMLDLLGEGLGQGQGLDPNSSRRGASVSPPRPPHAYAAPIDSAIYKVA